MSQPGMDQVEYEHSTIPNGAHDRVQLVHGGLTCTLISVDAFQASGPLLPFMSVCNRKKMKIYLSEYKMEVMGSRKLIFTGSITVVGHVQYLKNINESSDPFYWDLICS